jgi:phosphatidylglycerophosphate synthase
VTQAAATTPPWVLVLERPSSDPTARLGGLSLALRLALDAQAASAAAIVVSADAALARPALADPRLRLPLLEHVPPGARRLRVPASYLVHRSHFRSLIAAAQPSQSELRLQDFPLQAPYGFAPLDVTESRRREAERALFRSLRKAEDGWTSRYLNRYLSLAVSRFLARTPLHPNQISIVILGVGVLGGVLAARGEFVLGALLFQAQSVLDGCDGELSRVTHRGSLTGEWLDTVGDDLTNYGFFGGAGYGLYQTTGSLVFLAAGLVTVFSGIVASAFEYRYLAKIGSGDLLKYPLSRATSEAMNRPKAPGFRLSALTPLFKRDTFVFLTLLAAAAGLLGGMLCLFAAAALGLLLAVLRTELRLAREARAA